MRVVEPRDIGSWHEGETHSCCYESDEFGPQWEPMATSVFDDEGHISVGALPSIDGRDICGNVVVEHDNNCKHMRDELHRSCW